MSSQPAFSKKQSAATPDTPPGEIIDALVAEHQAELLAAESRSQ